MEEVKSIWKLNERKVGMHNVSKLSPPLTIGGTVLKESEDLDLLGVTFDFKMTFEKLSSLSFQSSSSKI